MKKGTFLKKGHQKYPRPPYSIPFLSFSHQNKALYNFRKKGQRSIVERSIGLEYALRDLVPFVQFKKREKHPWRSITFSKVRLQLSLALDLTI